MKLTHRIKLIGSKLRWLSELAVNSAKYRTEIKEMGYLHKLRRELLDELLAHKRLNSEEKAKEIQCKLNLINEIIKKCC